MTTAYTSLLGLALPVTGELSGTWGDTVNNSITSLLDSAIAGTTTLSTDADVTLTTTSGAANTAREAILLCSGARTGIKTVTAPAQSKIYTIINATTGGYAVKIVGAGPTTGLTIPNGSSAVIAWNGSDFIEIGSGTIGNLTVNGNLTVTGTTTLTGVATLTANPVLSAGTANGVMYANGSKVLTTGSALTFDGTTLANTGVFRKTNSAVGIETAYWGVVQNATGANNGTAFTLGVDTTTNYGQFQIAFDNLLNGTGSSMRWLLNNGSATAEKMRLDSSGNLLVGTTTSGATGAGVQLWNYSGTVGTAYIKKTASGSFTAVDFRYSGTAVGAINYSDTATAYVTSSDYRLKNITGPITTSGAYIDSLNPVEGTWKADGSTFVGLIAHEVQEASRTPVATGTKDGEEMQGMDYSSAEIIANLIAEIQSLRKRLTALEGKA